jgi:hypothetical protein
MKAKRMRSQSFKNVPGDGMDGKSVVGLCLLFMILAGLACTLPTGGDTGSVDETQVALDVQATTLAIREAELNQQAGSQPEAPPSQSEPPTPTATTQPAAPPPQASTVTPTPTVEAGTSVEGSLVRASYDPAADWGAGHDVENFDGTKGLFPASSAGAATSWYEDGRYHIRFGSRGRWTWYWTFLDPANFYADIVVINGDKCVSNDSAGMIFRGDSGFDYGYMFGITCGGEYFVGITAVPGADGLVWSIENGIILIGERNYIQSDLIDTGPGAMNRIGVMAKGGDFDLYINGQWAGEFSYWGFPPVAQWAQGNVALYLGTAQKPDARVSFEDFSLWNLP